MFDELVQRVSPRITKTDTHMRKALSPGLKIAITVRYLASGKIPVSCTLFEWQEIPFVF